MTTFVEHLPEVAADAPPAYEPRAPEPPNPELGPAEPGHDDGARRHLRVAPDLARRQRRARVAFWIAALVTVASLFALVSFHVMGVQQAFELDRLTEQQAEEARRYEQLRAEVARRSSPAAIVEAAQAMGMVFSPDPVTQLVAPVEAPTEPADREISDALSDAHEGAKPSLGP